MIGLIVAAVLVVAIVAFVWVSYNRMVGKRQMTENSWAQIEVALKRRHDLIPALVEAVKGYATHERTTFENVTTARSTAIAAQGPASKAAAEAEVGRDTQQLMVVAENYPQLQASQNFSKLQDDLREAEDQIAITRRVYNDTVETYNTAIQVFPALVVDALADRGRAGLLHDEPRVAVLNLGRLRKERDDVLLAVQLGPLQDHRHPDDLAVLGADRSCHPVDLGQFPHPLIEVLGRRSGGSRIQRSGPGMDDDLLGRALLHPARACDRLGPPRFPDSVVLGSGFVGADRDADA